MTKGMMKLRIGQMRNKNVPASVFIVENVRDSGKQTNT